MGHPTRDGFGAFFRRYARTWQHAVATAALTAFGTLTFVDRLFAVLAILAYVLPPAVLYLRGSAPERAPPADGDRHAAPAGGEQEPASDRDDGPTDDRDGPGDPDPDPAWSTSSVPTGEALLDAAVDGEAAYAVGTEGVVLVDDGDGWSVAVPDGPAAGANALRGVAAVGGGGVWFAGDDGAVGRFDPTTGRHVDHSAPNDDTTGVVDVAAAGAGGDETVLLVDGSGRVRRGRYRDGETAWDDPVTPGSGSSLAGVALADASTGYACDTSQCVFETDDGGRSFARIGPDGAGGTFTDVAATGAGACATSADDGVVHRYDDGTWTPERLGDDAVWALALDGRRGLAGGDGGAVYERSADAGGWTRVATPATGALRGVAVGPSRAVAVGADGTVAERSVALVGRR